MDIIIGTTEPAGGHHSRFAGRALEPSPTDRGIVVIQLVRVTIRPEQRDRWLEIIRDNASTTRTEDGCESYQIGEDLEAPDTFVIVERWANLDAQFSHLKTPAFAELMGALGDVLAGPPEVAIHEVASTLTLDEALSAAGVSQ